MRFLAVAAVLLLAACGSDEPAFQAPPSPTSGTPAADGVPTVSGALGSKPTVTIPDAAPPTSLVTRDVEAGTGAEATAGAEVTVQYVGISWSTKQQFDASWDRAEPFTFPLGRGRVIPGWDQGVAGMRVGGRRLLVIPPALGYGAAGAGADIGPNETLVFVVDLVDVG